MDAEEITTDSVTPTPVVSPVKGLPIIKGFSEIAGQVIRPSLPSLPPLLHCHSNTTHAHKPELGSWPSLDDQINHRKPSGISDLILKPRSVSIEG